MKFTTFFCVFLLAGLIALSLGNRRPEQYNGLDATHRMRIVIQSSSNNISPATYEQYPDIGSDVDIMVQGGWIGELIPAPDSTGNPETTDLIYLQTTENFYAVKDQVFPIYSATFYNRTTQKLDSAPSFLLTSTLGTGITASGISTALSNPYVVYSTLTNPWLSAAGAIIPNETEIFMHALAADGSISETPCIHKNLENMFGNEQAINNYLNRTIAYNGMAGKSDDGVVLGFTWALGSIPGIVEGQKIGFAVVNCAAGTTIEIVSAHTPPVTAAGYYAFPQKMIIRHQHGFVYSVVIAYNSWNFFNPLGKASFVALYTLDISAKTLVLHDRAPIPQYIQGLDVDWQSRVVYTVNNGVSTTETLRLEETQIFDVNSPDENSELRMFEMNHSFDSIRYAKGVDFGMDGVQVHVRPEDGAVFAVMAPVIYDNGIATINPIAPVAKRYGPTTVIGLRPTRNTELSIESIAAAPALGFAVATWEEVLVVGGQAGYSAVTNVYTGELEISGTDEILSYVTK